MKVIHAFLVLYNGRSPDESDCSQKVIVLTVKIRLLTYVFKFKSFMRYLRFQHMMSLFIIILNFIESFTIRAQIGNIYFQPESVKKS